MSEQVNHPTHYQKGGKECIDVMVETFGVDAVINFCECNEFKYLWRAGLKEGNSEEQDHKKAEWYRKKAEELRLNTQNVKIRRNVDITFDSELTERQRKSFLELFSPKMMDKYVEEMLDENKRLKRRVCEKIMAYCAASGQKDLDGNLITSETHEVDCDLGFTTYEGEQWAFPTQWYVRPKKSEHEL